MITLIYPINGSVVDTHTEIQKKFISLIREEGITKALEWLLPFKKEGELSFPEPIKFAWSNGGKKEYTFELSEREDFSSSYTVKTASPGCSVTNLKIGTRYYWRVNGGSFSTFRTEDSKFRFIEAEGALNVRDFGGINIEQGLLYRGSEISDEYKLTEDGKKAMRDLNIKTEVSLRQYDDISDRESCIGEGVVCKRMPYRPYTEIFLDEHRRELVDIMKFLADEKNYPIYFHCLGGADRTGMLAIYLRALMDEEEEDILTDYELTSLSAYAFGRAEGVSALGYRSRTADYFQSFYSLFNEYSGTNLREKTEAFLIECGVESATIQKIRNIIRKRS